MNARRPCAGMIVALVVLPGACTSEQAGRGETFELRAPAAATPTHGAPSVIVVTEPFELRVRAADGTTILSTLSAPAAGADDPDFVPRTLQGWDGYVENVPRWFSASRAEVTARTDTTIALRFDAGGDGRGSITLHVTLDGAKVVLEQDARLNASAGAPPWNKTSLSFRLPPEEHFFGLGERFATFDHRGHSLYSWAEEAGLGKGESAPVSKENPFPNGPSMTYFPIPFFHSTAGYAMHVDTSARSEVHFGSEDPNTSRVAVNAERFRIVVYVGEPAANLQSFTKDTGRAFIPAPWAFGPRRRVNVDALVGGVPEIELMRARKVPVTTVDDTQHFRPANDTLDVATLKRWTDKLHSWGYKATAYNNPYVASNIATAAADFQAGRDAGHFLTDETGKPGLVAFVSGTLLEVAAIDFTSASAEAWFGTLLQRTLDAGYDGTMLDFGEYVGRNWKTSDGRRGADVHNLYPVWSAKAAHAFFEAKRPNDYVFYVRSGYVGSAAYTPEVWGGDPEATFDLTQGLPAALRGGLNLALSGVPFWSTDIGGFKCYTDAPRDKEVYLRWVQVGAVSPMMHDEDACANVLGARTKWTLWSDDETVDNFAKMARLHTRLQPYWLTLAREARDTGMPVLRPPVLLFPREPRTYTIDDAFFVGPALYAAPVVRRGEREKKTWLPPGTYVDLEDFRVYPGAREVSIPAPLTKVPLLLVSGSILPLLDATVDTLAPTTRDDVVSADKISDRLDVLVALARGQRSTLTLLDGTVLEATREASEVASPDLLTSVASADIATCSRCAWTAREGDVDRLRISTELAPETRVNAFDVRVSAKGPSARRVRWDIFRIDQ